MMANDPLRLTMMVKKRLIMIMIMKIIKVTCVLFEIFSVSRHWPST